MCGPKPRAARQYTKYKDKRGNGGNKDILSKLLALLLLLLLDVIGVSGGQLARAAVSIFLLEVPVRAHHLLDVWQAFLAAHSGRIRWWKLFSQNLTAFGPFLQAIQRRTMSR